MATHFIADLHLQASRPDLTAVFHRYLQGPAREAHALYILGDLFEYWIGDDGSLPEYPDTLNALATLSNAGVNLFFMRGNRDFAVGPAFAQAADLRILSDPLLIDLYGTPTLLTHGDMLCSDDKEHQKFRSKYTDPAWRARMLKLPKFVRRAAARRARSRSKANTRNLPANIMDVNPESVCMLMQEYGAARLIHGHTHRPQRHSVDMGDQTGERWVLADWRSTAEIDSRSHASLPDNKGAQGSVLICDASGCRVKTLV